MDLPVEIVNGDGAGPCGGPELARIRVDGFWPGRGLVLSHWPGHATPADLRHDLSTGAALRFAALPEDERARRAEGAVSIANNHYDTDGVCALWAVRHPREAALRSERLLESAAAGDFFAAPTDEAVLVDLCVSRLGSADGPLANQLAALDGEDARARHQLLTDHWMEHLGALLDGDRGAYRALWEPGLARLAADRARLLCAERRDEPELDLTGWVERTGSVGEANDSDGETPGRHALQGGTPRDFALFLAEGTRGTLCRLLLSTRAWFDLVSRPRRPRLDLRPVATRLNELEATAEEDPAAWRAQPPENPSPELWFGARELASFAEHNEALRPSRLAPAEIMTELRAGLTAARRDATA